MPDSFKVPLLGNMNKTTALMAGGTAVVVTGYLLYKHNKTKTAAAAATTGYGYGATGYGYGSEPQGYYGYGYGYGNAGMGSGSFAPYPVGSQYGYGAYGYGYYNPYTGQWIGPQSQVPPVVPPKTQPPTPAPIGAYPNPSLAQEQRAYAPGRAASEIGKLFQGGKWYTVPRPPATSGSGAPGTHTISASGTMTLAATGRANGISEFQLLAYNPNLAYLYGSKKPIPRGTRVKV